LPEHRIALNWERGDAPFTYDAYPRNHAITFKNGVPEIFSASPAYKGDAAKGDPEDMLVASLSSCHMLSFLAIAAKKKSLWILTRTIPWDFWKMTAEKSGWRAWCCGPW
jgi:organic hydroperoxide reductase OsmC/OhrA